MIVKHGRTSRDRGDAGIRLVRFCVGETQYAFAVNVVREVVNRAPVTVLPRLPATVVGVADHRGSIIPIVDLRLQFGTQPTPQKRLEKWILVESTRGIVGFLVDRVIDVFGTHEDMAPPPPMGGAIDARGIRGVVHAEGSLIFVLDPNMLSMDIHVEACEPTEAVG